MIRRVLAAVGDSKRASAVLSAALDIARGAGASVRGSHGYDLVDRVLGTTAAKVANVSTRDVLVVHRGSVGAT